ncbi:MAG: ribbon-helix-helix protein, CopG family [Clostridia bacterium]|nr:ribbon-helix-helix protein, CopG family [Clostridia bacterium]
MTISVRLNDEDTKLIKAYAKMNKITLSELLRNAIMEKIEDEYDLKSYKKAKEEYEKNPTTYSMDEMKKELGL